MLKQFKIMALLTVAVVVGMLPAASRIFAEEGPKYFGILTSDTILSGMTAALLPAHRYRVEAILPPGQCPGHYDVKLSDIEKVQKAGLVISFRGMPFMGKMHADNANRLALDNDKRNWMAPDSYVFGINRLAGELIKRFPQEQSEIEKRRKNTTGAIHKESQKIQESIKKAGIAGQAVLASSMQQEPLEWMGFRVVAVYGRPEAMSAKEMMRLLKIGKKERIVAVVDNLQSGPDAGKSIAETLGVPHIVLNNFPTRQGYLATLQENVSAVLTALERP